MVQYSSQFSLIRRRGQNTVKGHIDEVSGVCLLCQKWVNAGSKGLWELGNGIPQPNPFTVEADGE